MPRLTQVLMSAVLLGAAMSARAQFTPPETVSFRSEVLHQQRSIDVYLPDEAHKDPAARYETLYILDGDGNTPLVMDVVRFLRQTGFMPPLIVVSVPNYFDAHGLNSRDHDLTPTVNASQPRSGGAAEFLQFFKSELLPWVNTHYPANGVNSIHGHSYGGLFLFYVLTHDPDLFGGYLLLDPSLWWDNRMFVGVLQEQLPHLDGKGKAIYVGARSGAAFEGMGLAAVEPLFRQLASPQLHWSIRPYEGETHDSLKLKGTYDALRYVYGGYSAVEPQVAPAAGQLVRGKPFALWAIRGGDALNLRYTTDGSQPTEASPRITDFVPTDSANIRVRSVSNRGIYDREVPLHLTNGAVLPPSPGLPDPSDTQWHVSLYEPAAWPQFARSRPFRVQNVAHLRDLSPPGRDDYSAVLTHELQVEKDGYYVFVVNSPAPVRLLVAGKLIASIEGTEGSREQSIVEPLQRGTYRLQLLYRHPDKDAQADLLVFQNPTDDSPWWRHRVLQLSDAGS